ncbi:MAG: GFA family protein [Thermoleophilia bacterium]
MRGHCLCGQVSFDLDGDRFSLYQCHCSQCRRQGGSLANAATIVPSDRLRWRSGTRAIRSWVKESGFRSDFCSTCGSPVPNPLRDLPFHWVPAGLLEDVGGLTIVAHVSLSSRATWDDGPLRGACFAEVPSLAEFIALLDPGSRRHDV